MNNGGVVAYLEEEEDGGGANAEPSRTRVGASGRDFFTEDYYDYKDTFKGGQQRPAAALDEFNEEDEYEEEEEDDNNDFKTGPLATKHDDDDDVDVENRHSFFAENDEFDEEEDDMLAMGTFFKRVDSQELVKPKKAKVISNYLIGELLGDGSYGKVKECLDMRDLSRCAVKIINLKMVARKIPRGVENVRKEISIMRRLEHVNLIKLHDTFEKGPMSALPASYGNYNKPAEVVSEDDDPLAATTAAMMTEKPPKIYIFMDYCMTSLEKLIKTAPEQRLRNYQANYYFKQLVDGLEYLHSLNIIHNDIKPGNLLITCDNTLKVCDFSISAELKVFHEHELMACSNDNTDEYGSAPGSGDDEYRVNPDLLTSPSASRFPILQCTPMFQCPEMLAENMDELLILQQAPKIDIWSSGITLYQLTTGSLPFKGQTIHQIYENIRSSPIHMPSELVDKNLGKLLLGMLEREPVQRWSLKQIKDCEWYRKRHPVVQEELAPLPQDVVQNETSTFRMLQYLEKLCQQNDPSLDPDIVEAINRNRQMNTTGSDQVSSAGHQVIRYDSKHNHLPVQEPQTPAVALANGNGSAALKHTIDSAKSYNNQAAKLKKKHCILM